MTMACVFGAGAGNRGLVMNKFMGFDPGHFGNDHIIHRILASM